MQRLTIFCLILFILPACEKFMHPEEISIGKIENYNTLVSATEGVYGSLARIMGENYAYYANLKGDDINSRLPACLNLYGEPCPIPWNGPYLTTYSTDIAWELHYETIGSANNILNQFEPALNQNEETRKVLGEAYFIRAYCYLRLTRTFGQIPIITDIDINYNVQKPSFNEIYSLIEKDLKMAIELLPKNNLSSRIPFVTPHRGTAKAILAETYLSWAGYPCNDFQKYTLAAKEAGETIDSADYFGYGLLEDFSYLWDSAHYYNIESEFSLYFVNPPQEWGWNDKNNHVYGGMAMEWNNYGFLFGPEQLWIGFSYYCAEVNFFNNYPASYRKGITFYTDIYVPGSCYNAKLKNDTGYVHINQVGGCDRIAYRKFYYRNYEVDSNHGYIGYYGIPRIYLFRYAQTILTYAEAMARSGQLNTKAYECVNQIRRRAHHLDLYSPSIYDLQPGLSSEAFADSVVWERAWELCGEPEGRWFDLIRLEKVEELPGLRYALEGGPPKVFDKSVYFFDIPAIDTILNPNLGN